MEIKWGKLRKLPINLFQTRNSHSINEQAFRHTLPLHHLARYPAYFRLCYCFCSTHSLIIPVLLWLAGMKCLHSPKLSQLCLSSLHFLPQGPHSVPWYHHIYVIAASSSVFRCDLSLALIPHSHDASISVPLKINSPYSPEIYFKAHTIDIN